MSEFIYGTVCINDPEVSIVIEDSAPGSVRSAAELVYRGGIRNRAEILQLSRSKLKNKIIEGLNPEVPDLSKANPLTLLRGSTSNGVGVPLLLRLLGVNSTILLLSVSATHRLSAGLHQAGDAVPQAATTIAIAAIERNENAADLAEVRRKTLNVCIVVFLRRNRAQYAIAARIAIDRRMSEIQRSDSNTSAVKVRSSLCLYPQET